MMAGRLAATIDDHIRRATGLALLRMTVPAIPNVSSAYGTLNGVLNIRRKSQSSLR